MDALYTVIKDFLDSLFPSAVLSTWGNLNELIAILFTYAVLWLVIIKPVITAFKSTKGRGK